MTRLRGALPLAALSLVVAGCSGADPGPTGAPGSTGSAPASPVASPPAGGTPQSPTVLTPVDAPADWQPTPGSPPGSTRLTVTTDGAWTLSLDEAAGEAELSGPDGPVQTPAGVAGRVSDALLGDSWAVVVHQDAREQAPATAVVTDLATGETSLLDGSTPGAPTTSGGTWALDGDRAAYASEGPDGAYCLAVADLAAGTAEVAWCAPDRTGFTAAHLSAAGDTLLTFDDAQPACRTLVTLTAAGTTPLAGPAETGAACEGFEAVSLDHGPVWSVVPDPERIEAAQHYARTEAGYYDLGPGTSGTLRTCAGAAYFVQDPQGDGDPARLMRFADGVLSTAYTSPGGQAFLDAPRCASDVLTISAYAEQGDEQVTARL